MYTERENNSERDYGAGFEVFTGVVMKSMYYLLGYDAV
jgi:hypothetical protein